MPTPGPLELVIILVIALLVLGPGKLPEVGASLGKSIREFRKASSDVQESVKVDVDTSPHIHMEGASNLLGLDLHLTRERMRDLFHALEEKQRLMELLDRFMEQKPGELAVCVGLEQAHPAMKDLALIGMTIRMANGLPAKIAVLGPMRMHYERVIAAVTQTSRALEAAQF